MNHVKKIPPSPPPFVEEIVTISNIEREGGEERLIVGEGREGEGREEDGGRYILVVRWSAAAYLKQNRKT